jgi:hypothetical protein
MNEALVSGLVVSAVASMVFSILHLMLWQMNSIKNRGLFLMLKISIVAYMVAIVIGYTIDYSISMHIWVSVPIFSCLLMFYLHFYVGVDRSVSIRILGELYQQENQSLSFDELNQCYPQDRMILDRVDLMVDKEWLSLEGGHYACTKKAETLAKSQIALKKLYALDITG